jgi:rhomboid family GlyGly-CTERM serine protease
MTSNENKFNLFKTVKENYAYHYYAILITFVSLLIMLFEPASSELFRYQSALVNDGQWWRIITANFCHSNWNHWLLNITGLWLMDSFFQPVISIRVRFYLLSFCIFSNVLFLHLFLDLKWYVGLSGALHGYIIGGAIISWASDRRINLAIIAVVTGKLLIEGFWEINSATEELIGANVVEEAHAFGAVSAVIFCIGYLASRKLLN